MNTQTLYMPSIIQLCRSALADEIHAIRQKGAKPLFLSDGHLVGEEAEGGFLYSFTLDAEVILPDDAPGKLTVGETHVDVTVISISGFAILLLVSQAVGHDVPSAQLVTDASFLLDKLRERLQPLATDPEAMKRASRLLLPPPLTQAVPAAPQQTMTPSASSPGSSGLNTYQLEAIRHVAMSDVSYIWGPPGTGKTTTLGHAVAALLQQGESVLVVAHSNAAVDAAAIAVSHQTHTLRLHAQGRILRVGVSRTPGIGSAILPREIVRRQQPALVQRIEELEHERDELSQRLAQIAGRASQSEQDRLTLVRKTLQERRNELRTAERGLVGDAMCVLCTLSKAAIAEEIFSRAFDATVIDEASMAYVPADLHVASLAGKRVAVFGDFRQLPPITQGDSSQIKDWLQPDIYEKARIVQKVDARISDSRLVMLAEQYRMHPDIAQIIARRFYGGKLTTGLGVETKTAPIADRRPQAGSAVAVVDTGGLSPFTCKESAGKDSAARRFGGNSRFNLISAIVAIELALAASAQSSPAITVGIITPYAAQARLITKLLHDLKVSRDRVLCATVHRFQGSERDVIIYDTVEGKPLTQVGRLLTADGSGVEARLLNVALSRARGKLIILGDLAHLRSVLPAENIYQRVLNDVMQHARPMRPSPPKQAGKGLATASALADITCFPVGDGIVDDSLRQALDDDLRTAELVAICGTEPRVSQYSLAALLPGLSAANLEARIFVGSAALPQISLHEHRWDGPTLPCLAIGLDQRLLWLHVQGYALRLAHAQTVKTLYGLWDLLPDSMRSLKTTEQQRELAQHGQSPLGRACPKCRSPLWIAVAYGRPSLKCPSDACGYSVPVSAPVATQYAHTLRVTCPQCGGPLEGKSGPEGVYLRCMGHPKCKGFRRLRELI